MRFYFNICVNCRNYLPSLEDYFEEAVEQADPAGGIEETYK